MTERYLEKLETAKITFEDVPRGSLRQIAQEASFAKIFRPIDLTARGISNEILDNLIVKMERPVYSGSKHHIEEDVILGKDLIHQIANDLGIQEDPEMAGFSPVNRIADLQQKIVSYLSSEKAYPTNVFILDAASAIVEKKGFS